MSIYEVKPVAGPLMEQNYPVVYKVVTWVRMLTVTVALVMGFGWTYLMLHLEYAHGDLVFNPILIGMDAIVVAAMAYGVAWR